MSKVLILKDHWHLWKFIAENGQFVYSVPDDSGGITVMYAKQKITKSTTIYDKMDPEEDMLIDEFYVNDLEGGYVEYNLRDIVDHFGYTLENCEFIEI